MKEVEEIKIEIRMVQDELREIKELLRGYLDEQKTIVMTADKFFEKYAPPVIEVDGEVIPEPKPKKPKKSKSKPVLQGAN